MSILVPWAGLHTGCSFRLMTLSSAEQVAAFWGFVAILLVVAVNQLLKQVRAYTRQRLPPVSPYKTDQFTGLRGSCAPPGS